MYLLSICLYTKLFFSQFKFYTPNMFSRFFIYIIFRYCLYHFIFCWLIPLSTIISTQRSAGLIFLYYPIVFIDTISLFILKLPRVRFLALIYPTSCQAQQISTSHPFPNSLAFIFCKCFFYILSNILADI